MLFLPANSGSVLVKIVYTITLFFIRLYLDLSFKEQKNNAFRRSVRVLPGSPSRLSSLAYYFAYYSLTKEKEACKYRLLQSARRDSNSFLFSLFPIFSRFVAVFLCLLFFIFCLLCYRVVQLLEFFLLVLGALIVIFFCRRNIYMAHLVCNYYFVNAGVD